MIVIVHEQVIICLFKLAWKKNNIFFTEQTNFPKDFETNFVLKKTILFYWINDFYKQLFEKR